MKISIDGTEIVINKDYSRASIQSSQDWEHSPICVNLYIFDLAIDHKAFGILDASFRNCETVNVKFLDNGFDRDLNMMVRSQDVILDGWKDIPTAYFNLECEK